LKVVVTIKKISTTNNTSMSETMMTEGVRRCFLPRKRMS
jgi:hypothetical protein